MGGWYGKERKEMDRRYVEKPNNEHNPTLTGRLALNSGSYTSETLSPSPPPTPQLCSLASIHPPSIALRTFLDLFSYSGSLGLVQLFSLQHFAPELLYFIMSAYEFFLIIFFFFLSILL